VLIVVYCVLKGLVCLKYSVDGILADIENASNRVLNGFGSFSSLQTKAQALKTGKMGCGRTFWGLLPLNLKYN